MSNFETWLGGMVPLMTAVAVKWQGEKGRNGFNMTENCRVASFSRIIFGFREDRSQSLHLTTSGDAHKATCRDDMATLAVVFAASDARVGSSNCLAFAVRLLVF